jgi:hypothetical protein
MNTVRIPVESKKPRWSEWGAVGISRDAIEVSDLYPAADKRAISTDPREGNPVLISRGAHRGP